MNIIFKQKINKILLIAIFVIASIGVITLFVTAATYAQLGIAVILYPVLAYFALKIFFPRVPKGLPIISPAQKPEAKSEAGNVLDSDKRTFLKLVGATGIFFFVSSLLGKWMGNIPLGKTLQSATNSPLLGGNPDSSGDQSSIFTSGGYTITEIDDGVITYYGFTNKNGSWLMMREDTDTNSFRYVKGNTDFPSNWANRENLKYDYFYNLR